MTLKERLDITLEETKHFLRVEHDLEDEFISDLIETAKEQADAYLNNDFKAKENGEWVNLPIPLTIKIACLKMIGAWYENRTDHLEAIGGQVNVQFGEIPWSAKKLLFAYRKQAWR